MKHQTNEFLEELKTQFGLELKLSKEQRNGQEVDDGQQILAAKPEKLETSVYITSTDLLLDAITNNAIERLETELNNTTLSVDHTPKKSSQDDKRKNALAISNNKYGLHPLVFAIVNKKKEAALKIINSYESIDDTVYPKYLLALAIKMFDDSEVALALIGKGFIHNEKKDFNAFHFAAEKGSVDVLKAIPENSKDWEIEFKRATSAFSLAIENGHKEFVKAVIDKKLIGTAIVEQCKYMVEKGWYDVISYGINIKNQFIIGGIQGLTGYKDLPDQNELLKIFIMAGHADIAIIFKTLSESDKLHTHAFYYLATPNLIKTQVFEYIESSYKEKYLNKQDAKGQTSLHVAVQENNLEAVKKLLAMGADVRVLDTNKNTALDYAEEPEAHEVNGVLRQHIIDKNITMPVVEQQLTTAASELQDNPEDEETQRAITKQNVIKAEEEERRRRIGNEDDYGRGGLNTNNANTPPNNGGDNAEDTEAAERQRLAAEEAQRAEAAKEARASKCNGIGTAFSTTLTGALCYATYANQELVLSMATSVLEHTYFTAAHTALANTEYGSMIISFVMENSQECMIAAASLAILASLVASFALGYKIADMTIAQPEMQA